MSFSVPLAATFPPSQLASLFEPVLNMMMAQFLTMAQQQQPAPASQPSPVPQHPAAAARHPVPPQQPPAPQQPVAAAQHPPQQQPVPQQPGVQAHPSSHIQDIAANKCFAMADKLDSAEVRAFSAMRARVEAQTSPQPPGSTIRSEQIMAQLVLQHLGSYVCHVSLHLVALAVVADSIARAVLASAQMLHDSLGQLETAPHVRATADCLQELISTAPATRHNPQDAAGTKAWVNMAAQLSHLTAQWPQDSRQHEQLADLNSLVQQYSMVCSIGPAAMSKFSMYRGQMARDAASVRGRTAANQTQLVQQHSRAARLGQMQLAMLSLTYDIAKTRTAPQTKTISRGDQQDLSPICELLDAKAVALLLLLFRLPVLDDTALPATLQQICSDMPEVAKQMCAMLEEDAAAVQRRERSLFSAVCQVQPTAADLPPVLQRCCTAEEHSVFKTWLRASRVLQLLDRERDLGAHVWSARGGTGDLFGVVAKRLAAFDQIYWGEAAGSCPGAVCALGSRCTVRGHAGTDLLTLCNPSFLRPFCYVCVLFCSPSNPCRGARSDGCCRQPHLG